MQEAALQNPGASQKQPKAGVSVKCQGRFMGQTPSCLLKTLMFLLDFSYPFDTACVRAVCVLKKNSFETYCFLNTPYKGSLNNHSCSELLVNTPSLNLQLSLLLT